MKEVARRNNEAFGWKGNGGKTQKRRGERRRETDRERERERKSMRPKRTLSDSEIRRLDSDSALRRSILRSSSFDSALLRFNIKRRCVIFFNPSYGSRERERERQLPENEIDDWAYSVCDSFPCPSPTVPRSYSVSVENLNTPRAGLDVLQILAWNWVERLHGKYSSLLYRTGKIAIPRMLLVPFPFHFAVTIDRSTKVVILLFVVLLFVRGRNIYKVARNVCPWKFYSTPSIWWKYM